MDSAQFKRHARQQREQRAGTRSFALSVEELIHADNHHIRSDGERARGGGVGVGGARGRRKEQRVLRRRERGSVGGGAAAAVRCARRGCAAQRRQRVLVRQRRPPPQLSEHAARGRVALRQVNDAQWRGSRSVEGGFGCDAAALARGGAQQRSDGARAPAEAPHAPPCKAQLPFPHVRVLHGAHHQVWSAAPAACRRTARERREKRHARKEPLRELGQGQQRTAGTRSVRSERSIGRRGGEGVEGSSRRAGRRRAAAAAATAAAAPRVSGRRCA